MPGRVAAVYTTTPAKIPEYFAAIQRGNAPSKLTTEFIENLGFKSKGDRALVGILKAIRFLDDNNAPTQAYRDYLDHTRAKQVLARQLLAAYEGIFELDRAAHQQPAASIEGKFKSLANATESTARLMALTFTRLCSLADFDSVRNAESGTETIVARRVEVQVDPGEPKIAQKANGQLSLAYNIQIVLPNTTDVEVFRAIFKALREHLPEAALP
jgi:hypothetical protein